MPRFLASRGGRSSHSPGDFYPNTVTRVTLDTPPTPALQTEPPHWPGGPRYLCGWRGRRNLLEERFQADHPDRTRRPVSSSTLFLDSRTSSGLTNISPGRAAAPGNMEALGAAGWSRELSVGTSRPLRETELKASGQDKASPDPISTPPVSLQCPSPTLSNLALPAPTRKGRWPHFSPCPYRGLVCPQPTSECILRPSLSPTLQPGSRCLRRPRLPGLQRQTRSISSR